MEIKGDTRTQVVVLRAYRGINTLVNGRRVSKSTIFKFISDISTVKLKLPMRTIRQLLNISENLRCQISLWWTKNSVSVVDIRLFESAIVANANSLFRKQ